MTDISDVNRIVIIGSGGAGKSTLALKLSEITRLPVVHLDRLFWNGHWTHVGKDEFDAALETELAKEKWIMDGNFSRTLQIRLSHCDMALYLDYSPLVCVLGVLKRIARYHGKTRPDMGGDCPEKYDLEFLKWVFNFRRNNREALLKALAESGKQHYVFRNRKDCSLFLSSIYRNF